jgi:hypothetical protein
MANMQECCYYNKHHRHIPSDFKTLYPLFCQLWNNILGQYKFYAYGIPDSKKYIENYVGNKCTEFLQKMVQKIGDSTYSKFVYLFLNAVPCR